MAKYFLSAKAVEDLSRIWDYTYEVWSENQADRYYELLIDAFVEISENRDIGKRYDEIDNGVLGFRAGKHIVFYRVTESDEIEVLRILHQKMDLKNKMEE